MIHSRGILARAIGVAWLAACVALPAAAERVVRSTPDSLATDLQGAGPGDVFSLAPGTYAPLAVTGLAGTPQAPIVLRAHDRADPPRLAGLTLRDVAGVTLRGLTLAPPATAPDQPNLIADSRFVRLENIMIDGPDALRRTGLRIVDSRDLLITGAEITGLRTGLLVAYSERVEIRASLLHGLGSDGMNFAAVADLLVEDNTIRDFSTRRPEGAHPDMIQFWTNGTTRPSRRITIRGNRLISGDGPWSQSIFMGNETVDELQPEAEMLYEDVTIEDNVIVNAHLHGISIGDTSGLTIRRNTVVRDPKALEVAGDPNLSTPVIRIADGARDVLVLGNVAHAVPQGDTREDWLIAGNLIVQDRRPFQPGHYEAVFRTVDRTRPARLGDFRPHAAGPLAGRDVGAPMLRGPSAPAADDAPADLPDAIALRPEAEALRIANGVDAPLTVAVPDGRILLGDLQPQTRLSVDQTSPLFGAEAFRLALRLHSDGSRRGGGGASPAPGAGHDRRGSRHRRGGAAYRRRADHPPRHPRLGAGARRRPRHRHRLRRDRGPPLGRDRRQARGRHPGRGPNAAGRPLGSDLRQSLRHAGHVRGLDQRLHAGRAPSPAARGAAAMTAATTDLRGAAPATGSASRALVPLYLLAVVVPVGMHLGPLYLTGLRILLLAVTLPLLAQLLRGRYGPVIATDWLFVGFAAWMTLALLANNPDRVIQQAPSVGVEFLGGYVIARATIRSVEAFLGFCRIILLVILIVLPAAIYEALTGASPIVRAIAALPGLVSVDEVPSDPRLGLERVQAIFAHPIHFGLFCSIAFSMTFVGLKDTMSDTRRWLAAGAVAGAGFLALSSGALLAIALQLGMIVWAATFRRLTWRWWLLVGLFALAYATVGLLSNRTAIQVFLSYATFSAHNAYWRAIIFEWGMMNVWANPILGIGLNEWVRPDWMHSSSVDNFWLLTAMRYGLPAFALLTAGWLTILVRLMRLPLAAESREGRIRRACVFTLIGLAFTLATVHVWTNIYSFTFFILGSTAFLLHPAEPSEVAPDGPRPGKGERQTRAERARRPAPSYTRFPEPQGAARPPRYARR
ncbi:right-handed parallel beta-helix repeat-containing protein [Jannaschia ovalis]|uniref:Right-handed parallel beta-helix repeat-containing protein n=1 Tax=Jannaschia ovalis TaxID=3038773 RepID=A0ABY8L7N8_9RHOB|nr:right-handed parallel beta-helix repeat-containing protein [Jannaschia sp. GRR-S6-38]WGH77269.1 right-handed parallel beta-helix repeat-containing protein [Jannaschia sp. GRR-S6-38]